MRTNPPTTRERDLSTASSESAAPDRPQSEGSVARSVQETSTTSKSTIDVSAAEASTTSSAPCATVHVHVPAAADRGRGTTAPDEVNEAGTQQTSSQPTYSGTARTAAPAVASSGGYLEETPQAGSSSSHRSTPTQEGAVVARNHKHLDDPLRHDDVVAEINGVPLPRMTFPDMDPFAAQSYSAFTASSLESSAQRWQVASSLMSTVRQGSAIAFPVPGRGGEIGSYGTLHTSTTTEVEGTPLGRWGAAASSPSVPRAQDHAAPPVPSFPSRFTESGRSIRPQASGMRASVGAEETTGDSHHTAATAVSSVSVTAAGSHSGHTGPSLLGSTYQVSSGTCSSQVDDGPSLLSEPDSRSTTLVEPGQSREGKATGPRRPCPTTTSVKASQSAADAGPSSVQPSVASEMPVTHRTARNTNRENNMCGCVAASADNGSAVSGAPLLESPRQPLDSSTSAAALLPQRPPPLPSPKRMSTPLCAPAMESHRQPSETAVVVPSQGERRASPYRKLSDHNSTPALGRAGLPHHPQTQKRSSSSPSATVPSRMVLSDYATGRPVSSPNVHKHVDPLVPPSSKRPHGCLHNAHQERPMLSSERSEEGFAEAASPQRGTQEASPTRNTLGGGAPFHSSGPPSHAYHAHGDDEVLTSREGPFLSSTQRTASTHAGAAAQRSGSVPHGSGEGSGGDRDGVPQRTAPVALEPVLSQPARLRSSVRHLPRAPVAPSLSASFSFAEAAASGAVSRHATPAGRPSAVSSARAPARSALPMSSSRNSSGCGDATANGPSTETGNTPPPALSGPIPASSRASPLPLSGSITAGTGPWTGDSAGGGGAPLDSSLPARSSSSFLQQGLMSILSADDDDEGAMNAPITPQRFSSMREQQLQRGANSLLSSTQNGDLGGVVVESQSTPLSTVRAMNSSQVLGSSTCGDNVSFHRATPHALPANVVGGVALSASLVRAPSVHFQRETSFNPTASGGARYMGSFGRLSSSQPHAGGYGGAGFGSIGAVSNHAEESNALFWSTGGVSLASQHLFGASVASCSSYNDTSSAAAAAAAEAPLEPEFPDVNGDAKKSRRVHQRCYREGVVEQATVREEAASRWNLPTKHLNTFYCVLNQKYVVYQHELGRGSFSRVHLAYNVEDGAYYAAKLLEKHRLQRNGLSFEAASHQVWHEINIMKQLRHKNIVALREVFDNTQSRKAYLILELAERGEVLTMRGDGTIEPYEDGLPCYEESTAVRVVKGILEAVMYAHHLGIAHRDIKPSNILLTTDGVVKLSDFGVSTFVDDNVVKVPREGSIAFLPPEMLVAAEVEVAPWSPTHSSSLMTTVTGEDAAALLTDTSVDGAFPVMAPPPSLSYRCEASGGACPASPSSDRAAVTEVNKRSPSVRVDSPCPSSSAVATPHPDSGTSSRAPTGAFHRRGSLKSASFALPEEARTHSCVDRYREWWYREPRVVDLFKTDVFSLGVTTFALLMGRLPWSAKDAPSQLRAELTTPDPFLPSYQRVYGKSYVTPKTPTESGRDVWCGQHFQTAQDHRALRDGRDTETTEHNTFAVTNAVSAPSFLSTSHAFPRPTHEVCRPLSSRSVASACESAPTEVSLGPAGLPPSYAGAASSVCGHSVDAGSASKQGATPTNELSSLVTETGSRMSGSLSSPLSPQRLMNSRSTAVTYVTSGRTSTAAGGVASGRLSRTLSQGTAAAAAAHSYREVYQQKHPRQRAGDDTRVRSNSRTTVATNESSARDRTGSPSDSPHTRKGATLFFAAAPLPDQDWASSLVPHPVDPGTASSPHAPQHGGHNPNEGPQTTDGTTPSTAAASAEVPSLFVSGRAPHMASQAHDPDECKHSADKQRLSAVGREHGEGTKPDLPSVGLLPQWLPLHRETNDGTSTIASPRTATHTATGVGYTVRTDGAGTQRQPGVPHEELAGVGLVSREAARGEDYLCTVFTAPGESGLGRPVTRTATQLQENTSSPAEEGEPLAHSDQEEKNPSIEVPETTDDGNQRTVPEYGHRRSVSDGEARDTRPASRQLSSSAISSSSDNPHTLDVVTQEVLRDKVIRPYTVVEGLMLPAVPGQHGDVSAEAVDFVRCCLDLDARHRRSVFELFHHPWIQSLLRTAPQPVNAEEYATTELEQSLSTSEECSQGSATSNKRISLDDSASSPTRPQRVGEKLTSSRQDSADTRYDVEQDVVAEVEGFPFSNLDDGPGELEHASYDSFPTYERGGNSMMQTLRGGTFDFSALLNDEEDADGAALDEEEETTGGRAFEPTQYTRSFTFDDEGGKISCSESDDGGDDAQRERHSHATQVCGEERQRQRTSTRQHSCEEEASEQGALRSSTISPAGSLTDTFTDSRLNATRSDRRNRASQAEVPLSPISQPGSSGAAPTLHLVSSMSSPSPPHGVPLTGPIVPPAVWSGVSDIRSGDTTLSSPRGGEGQPRPEGSGKDTQKRRTVTSYASPSFSGRSPPDDNEIWKRVPFSVASAHRHRRQRASSSCRDEALPVGLQESSCSSSSQLLRSTMGQVSNTTGATETTPRALNATLMEATTGTLGAISSPTCDEEERAGCEEDSELADNDNVSSPEGEEGDAGYEARVVEDTA